MRLVSHKISLFISKFNASIIIIQYIDCSLDINFDQNVPNTDVLTFITDKKVQKKLIDESEFAICPVDQVITNEMCDSFKIAFKVTWSDNSYGSYCRIGQILCIVPILSCIVYFNTKPKINK